MAKTQQLNKLQQITPNFTTETWAVLGRLASKVSNAAAQVADGDKGAEPDQLLQDELTNSLERYRKWLPRPDNSEPATHQ